jgi:hypothetical protein
LITIGIDPHKASVTAAALDPQELVLDTLRLPTSTETGTQLLAFTARWPVRRWAVEGATGLGHGVAQQLVVAGETVLDVPAKLTARARLLGSGSARKTDPADAASAVAVAIHNRQPLCMSTRGRVSVAMVSHQVPVDHVGELALERAAGLLGGLGLAQLALVVDLSWAGVADLADRDEVQGGVELPVAAPVQPMAAHITAGGFEPAVVAVDHQRELPQPALECQPYAERLVVGADPPTLALRPRQPLLPRAGRLARVMQQPQPPCDPATPNGSANRAANPAVPLRCSTRRCR